MLLIEQFWKKKEKKVNDDDENIKENKYTDEELAIIEKGEKVKSVFKAPE